MDGLIWPEVARACVTAFGRAGACAEYECAEFACAEFACAAFGCAGACAGCIEQGQDTQDAAGA